VTAGRRKKKDEERECVGVPTMREGPFPPEMCGGEKSRTEEVKKGWVQGGFGKFVAGSREKR